MRYRCDIDCSEFKHTPTHKIWDCVFYWGDKPWRPVRPHLRDRLLSKMKTDGFSWNLPGPNTGSSVTCISVQISREINQASVTGYFSRAVARRPTDRLASPPGSPSPMLINISNGSDSSHKSALVPLSRHFIIFENRWCSNRMINSGFIKWMHTDSAPPIMVAKWQALVCNTFSYMGLQFESMTRSQSTGPQRCSVDSFSYCRFKLVFDFGLSFSSVFADN